MTHDDYMKRLERLGDHHCSTDCWGEGDAGKYEKAFDTTVVGEGRHAQTVELIHGDHPHSRSDNSHYARWPDGRVEGFDGHRLLISIELHDYNYLKTSGLSGNEVRKGGNCKITVNGQPWHSFFFRDIQRALLQAHREIDKLEMLPIKDLLSRKKLKIWYDGQPALVVGSSETGELDVVPDGIPAFEPPRDWNDPEDGNDILTPSRWRESYSKGLRVERSDPRIRWYRR